MRPCVCAHNSASGARYNATTKCDKLSEVLYGVGKTPESNMSVRYFHRASGSGRNWKCTAMGLLPLPPSLSHGVLSPLVVHKPRPFQPAFASSMRPSKLG